MKKHMKLVLTQAATLTFEELGFLFPDSDISDEQKQAPAEAQATVSFSGPFDGRLVVRFYGDLLPELAGNMLGQHQTPDDSLQMDALGEVANVICGNALPSICSSPEAFHLSPPEAQRASREGFGAEKAAPTVVAQLGLEEGRAEILLFVDASEEELASLTQPVRA